MTEGAPLATVLRERASEVLAGWIMRFERSPLRFRRAAKAASYTAQVASLLESLTAAAHTGVDGLRPGQDATRELERSAAFLGGRFAAEGATGFDIAAMLLELRDVVAGITEPAAAVPLTRLFEWLTVVALDAFAASGLQSLREQTAEQLEAGTPIAELLPKVPVLFLVAAPTASVLDNLLGRAWMLAVQCGAPCLIIDCAGLAEAGERGFDRAFRSFLDQVEGSALQVCLASARRPLRELVEKLTGERSVSFQHFDRIDSAIAHALERAGQLLMKRS